MFCIFSDLIYRMFLVDFQLGINKSRYFILYIVQFILFSYRLSKLNTITLMNNDRILEKLKELRLAKGITEDQAAKHIHISKEAFRKIESGVNNSIFKYWMELIDFYGSNMEEFMKSVTGNNIIFKDNTMETGYVHSQHHYSDKPMVKSLLGEKDKVIKMQDDRISSL